MTPQNNKNALGARRDESQFGWLGPVITKIANSRRWAFPLTGGCSIIVASGYPLQLAERTPTALTNDCITAIQGEATKKITTYTVPGTVPVTDTDVTAGGFGVKAFGVRIRISSQITSFKFGAYDIQLFDGATKIATATIQPSVVPSDFVLFGISDSGGKATVRTLSNPVIKITAPASWSWATGDTITCESLNLRDIGELA